MGWWIGRNREGQNLAQPFASVGCLFAVKMWLGCCRVSSKAYGSSPTGTTDELLLLQSCGGADTTVVSYLACTAVYHKLPLARPFGVGLSASVVLSAEGCRSFGITQDAFRLVAWSCLLGCAIP